MSALEVTAKKAVCVYGNPIYAICVNPACQRPAALCQHGYHNDTECANFHQQCTKTLWSKVEDRIGHNPNVCCPDFHFIRDKIDAMFLSMLEKIQEEHSKFKFWVKTYGYSLEVMKFIKRISEHNYQQMTGAALNPVVNEILSSKRIQLPNIVENEVITFHGEMMEQLDRISDLYLKPGTNLDKSIAIAPQIVEVPKHIPHISKVVKDFTIFNSFFSNRIGDMKLLYRASEHNYSIKEFHRLCDGEANTVVFAETEFGKIIGGYTPIAWSSVKKKWAADKSLESFVFSLNMKEKFPLNLVQFAIANNPDKGPIFGCCDICIVNNANKERSNAQFPISYNNGKYVRSPDSCFAFTGHPKGQFLVREWEVFKLTFE